MRFYKFKQKEPLEVVTLWVLCAMQIIEFCLSPF